VVEAADAMAAARATFGGLAAGSGRDGHCQGMYPRCFLRSGWVEATLSG